MGDDAIWGGVFSCRLVWSDVGIDVVGWDRSLTACDESMVLSFVASLEIELLFGCLRLRCLFWVEVVEVGRRCGVGPRGLVMEMEWELAFVIGRLWWTVVKMVWCLVKQRRLTSLNQTPLL